MAKVTHTRRAQVFDLYARNLSLYDPSATDQFRCPVCSQLFGREAVEEDDPRVTVAHVVPERLSGRLWTLCCKDCNSRMGSKWDSHLVKEQRYHEFLRGDRPWPVCVKSSSGDIGAELSLREKALNFREIAAQTDPAQSRELRRELKSPFKMKYTMSLWKPKERDIALFHSAFLMMFRTFGYEYVLSPEVATIRRLLQGEDDLIKELRPALVTVNPDAGRERLSVPSASVLHHPSTHRCFGVVLPDPASLEGVRLVKMPGFGEEGKRSYARILASRGKNTPFRAKALHCPAFELLADSEYKLMAHVLWENMEALSRTTRGAGE